MPMHTHTHTNARTWYTNNGTRKRLLQRKSAQNQCQKNEKEKNKVHPNNTHTHKRAQPKPPVLRGAASHESCRKARAPIKNVPRREINFFGRHRLSASFGNGRLPRTVPAIRQSAAADAACHEGNRTKTPKNKKTNCIFFRSRFCWSDFFPLFSSPLPSTL